MPLSPSLVLELARTLLQAERTRQPVATLSARYPDLDEADAYRIAAAKFQLREKKRSGYKLGYTSAAMRRQMNIDTPNYGILTEDLLVADGILPHETLIHPLIEPEIAIRLGRDLAPSTRHDVQTIRAARPEYMLAIEVCDTRYTDYRFKAVDNIADNSSAARYVLGRAALLDENASLAALDVELWIDGERVDQGVGANALGDPLLAVAWLANLLGRDGSTLHAGELVLTGGLTQGYRMQAGQSVRVASPGLGDAQLRFAPNAAAR